MAQRTTYQKGLFPCNILIEKYLSRKFLYFAIDQPLPRVWYNLCYLLTYMQLQRFRKETTEIVKCFWSDFRQSPENRQMLNYIWDVMLPEVSRSVCNKIIPDVNKPTCFECNCSNIARCFIGCDQWLCISDLIYCNLPLFISFV